MCASTFVKCSHQNFVGKVLVVKITYLPPAFQSLLGSHSVMKNTEKVEEN